MLSKKGEAVSFEYLRPDAQATRHNAVYPFEIMKRGELCLFQGLSFHRDPPRFRLNKVGSLQLVKPTRSKEYPASRDRLTAIIVILVIPVSYMIWTFTGGDPKDNGYLVTT
jgi:hypothetical protein